jgi:hypothetical protein
MGYLPAVRAPWRPAAGTGGGARPTRASRPGARSPRIETWALLTTGLAYGVSQVQVWRVMLGWDESIYLSQVSRAAPAAFFSAPRARGITWLAAPLQPVSSSVTDLRVYLSVLSALALVLCFRVWFTVIAPHAAVLAAILFAGLWVTRFYGALLMPNLWVAFGGVAAVGGFLRLTADRHDRVGLVALPLGLAVAALMRPSDAAWLAAPMLAFAVLVPRWRPNLRLYLLIALGSALGAAPWVVEAYQRFGGILGRLRRAGAIQGGLGWHPESLLQHWRTMDGPLLCRPCTPAPTPPPTTFWWLVIPVAVVVMVLLARSGRKPDRDPEALPIALLPAAVGASVAFPYLFLLGYSAPRFLLPGWALLSLPVGMALHEALPEGEAGRRGHLRYVVTVVLVLALAAQILAQQTVLTRRTTSSARTTRVYVQLAEDLTRLGVRPPCVISGIRSPQIAFHTRCRSRNVRGHDGSITVAALEDLARRQPVALVLAPGKKIPHYARDWERHRLSVTHRGRPWGAYLAR